MGAGAGAHLPCWVVISALPSFGRLWLDRPSPRLGDLSGAIFADYILHQTIIIAVGAPLTRLGPPLAVEVARIAAATALTCAAIFHFVVRRIGRFAGLLGGPGAPGGGAGDQANDPVACGA